MLIFDKYAYNNRIVNLSPVIKFFMYIALLVISFLGITSLQLLLIFTMIPLTIYIAKVKIKLYFKWILVTFPFVFISLVTFVLTFSENQNALIYSIPFSNGFLGISTTSLNETITILLRVYSSLLSTYFFILTVPFQQLVQLLSQIKVPKFLLDIIILMYRFIFMFLHEFIVMRDTMDLKFGFKNTKSTYKSLGLLANNLFSKLMKANEHLNQMLELRFDK